MRRSEQEEYQAEGAIEDGSDGGDDEDEDEYYDEGEEEESEEETFGDRSLLDDLDDRGGEDFASEHGNGADLEAALSEVSNETDASDTFDPARPEREFAQVIPEPPWAGCVSPLFRLLLACLLPLLFSCFAAYALCKCLGALIQVIVDVWTICRQLIWLALRVALSPLYILWRLFVPSYIKFSVMEAYEQRVGGRLRTFLAYKRQAEELVGDTPNIMLACVLAASETCIMPLRTQTGSCCWFYLGRHLDEWVLQPLYDAHVDRILSRHRPEATVITADGKESQGARQPKLARARARAQREKAKKLRAKRRKQQLHITLNLPQNDKSGAQQQTVQLTDKDRSQMISRTMVVERRHAVAVGVLWLVLGVGLLTLTLNGAAGEACLVCQEDPALGVQVCRHGSGQDCAFQLHSSRVIIAIAMMGVGCVLLVYTLFLYKPRGNMDMFWKEKKRKKNEEMLDDNLGVMHKAKEEQDEVIEMLVAQMRRPTPGRLLRKLFRSSPCGSCVYACSFQMNGPLGVLVRFERRHKMRERSIVLQDWVYFILIGWFGALIKCMTTRGQVRRRRSGKEQLLDFITEVKVRLLQIPCLRRKQGQKVDAGSPVGRFIDNKGRVEGAERLSFEETLRKFGLLEAQQEEERRIEAEMKAKDKERAVSRSAAAFLSDLEMQLTIGALEYDTGIIEEEPDVHIPVGADGNSDEESEHDAEVEEEGEEEEEEEEEEELSQEEGESSSFAGTGTSTSERT